MAKNKMLHTVAHVNTKKLSDADIEAGIVRAVVGSTEVLDRAGDIIRQDGWDLKNFMKNRVILWGHNVRQDRPPIGKAIKVWLEGKTTRTKKLMFDIQFDLKDSFAAEIYRKVVEGFVNTVSVGFIPLEREDNVYTKNELLELSFVPVPANPEAVVTLRSAGLEPVQLKDLYSAKSDEEVEELLDEDQDDEEVDTNDTEDEETTENEASEEVTEDVADEVESTDSEEEVDDTESDGDTETDEEESTDDATEDGESEEEPVEETEETTEETEETEDTETETEEAKGVIPYKNMGKAPEGEEWDGPGEMSKCENVAQLKKICAWFDSEKPDAKMSYKLPHHKGGPEGNVAVWRGVAAAMAALLGARGGADLPQADRRKVYNHLAKHYKEFGKEAPAFKMVEDQVLAQLSEEIHAITLEREDKYAVRLLKKLLKQTKPEPKKQVITQSVKVDEQKAVEALQVIDQALTAVLTRTRDGKE